MFRSTLSVALIACLALTLGCVTRGRYQAVKEERDALAVQGETLTRENESLMQATGEMEDELAMRDEEIEQLKATQAELVEDLQALIVAGAIKIALMRDGLHLVLSDDILFRSGSARLTNQGRKVLGTVAEDLQEFPYQIAVFGHTDNVPVGSNLAALYPSNWELAAARASRVVRLLEGSGVASEQLVVVSFGEIRPYAPNDTRKGRAQNRRIEIRLRPVAP
jgi:chemotaxis protein MotB